MINRLKVLDLFSGIGGFSLGLERAGMETVAFCEIDPSSRMVLNKHWPDVPVYKDVRELNEEKFRKDGIERPDVICGGFPCQDLSVAGKQAGIKGERSGLWSEFSRLIRELRPRVAVVENVTDPFSGRVGTWLGRILGDLAEIGYDAEWECIPACSTGRPQRRDRVWILAYPMRGDKEMGRHLPGSWWESEQIQGYRFSYKESEPEMVGMVNGLPSEMDRLRQLGNAVVPQIPELIGRAIIELVGDEKQINN